MLTILRHYFVIAKCQYLRLNGLGPSPPQSGFGSHLAGNTTTVRRSNSPFSGLVYNFAGLNAVRIDCLILVSGSNVWSIYHTL